MKDAKLCLDKIFREFSQLKNTEDRSQGLGLINAKILNKKKCIHLQ